MSFAINPSLNHIDVPESLVYELYRSTTEILLPDTRFRGHPCEAYICIAKIDKSVKAYVALLEKGMKTVLVYTSDHSATVPAEYPQVYAQAEAFVKKMGFVMEPVNLGFSPAMREVIIKGFQVMRPPQIKKQPLRRLSTPAPPVEPVKIYEKTSPPPVSPSVSAAQGDLATELQSLQRELSSAKAVIEQVTREKVSLEQGAAVEIASLKALYEQAVEAKQKAAEMFAVETEKLKLEEHARRSGRDDAELTALRTELDTVTAAGKTAVNRLQEEITSLQHGMAQLESDKQALEQRLAAAEATHAEQLGKLAAEKDSLLGRIAAEENAVMAAADKIAEMSGYETSWREGQHREESLCRNLDLLQSQVDALESELQQYKEGAGGEEDLQLRLSSLESELQKYHEIESRDEALQLRLSSLETELQQYKEKEGREEALQLSLSSLETELHRYKEKEGREEALQLRLSSLETELQQYREGESSAEALQLKMNSLEQELVMAKSELAKAASVPVVSESGAPELQALLEEKMAVEAEYVRLANESREKELAMLDTIASARMETERLTREMEIQAQVAAMEHAALRAELRNMVVAGAGAVPATAPAAAVGEGLAPPAAAAGIPGAVGKPAALSSPEQSRAAAPLPVNQPVQAAAMQSETLPLDAADDDEPDRPIVSAKAISSGLMNEFGSFIGHSGYASTEFRIDPELSGVPYSDPEEIEVLLYSSNTVQAVPDGSSIQRCKGYVIATNKDGCYKVYVAWYLTESRSVVVCTPQQQPADSEECVSILQDAIAYFEVVGFMMELEELGESVRSYNQVLRKVPVICRAAKN